jgi:mono/diheme cytochrome c family protein
MPRASEMGLIVVVVGAAVVGCYTGNIVDANRAPEPETSEADPTVPVVPKAPTTKKKGLPCDIAEIVKSECVGCHGETRQAPIRLVSYEDFRAPSSDAERSVAQLSLARMKSETRPMPPSGKLEAARIAAFEAWVAAGAPSAVCDATATDTTPPKETPSVCTTNILASTEPGEMMHPGLTCIACHAGNRGPDFAIAGTVYPSLHEPNECMGFDGARVILLDADGVPHTLQTNAAGNFMELESFPVPYKALVARGTRILEMKTPQTNGDCNGCHTERGENGAPGRIMAP